MDNKRTDFNKNRNLEIFKEYVNTEITYSELAKKYSLTPQRIQAIIKDMINSGYSKTLKPVESKEERNSFLKEAEKLREAGNIALAVDMFEQVANWDRTNKNTTDLIDIYGHLRIIYTHIGDNKKNIEEKKEYFNKAEEAIEEALDIANKQPKAIDEGLKAVMYTHRASSILKTLTVDFQHERTTKLEKALTYIQYAVDNIAGSQAHKAWPKNIKSKVLLELGRKKEAFKVLQEAEADLFQGYNQEIKNDKNGNIKLKVWLCQIHISLAQLSKEMERPILARFYAGAVLNMQDSEGALKSIELQARDIIKSLKNNE